MNMLITFPFHFQETSGSTQYTWLFNHVELFEKVKIIPVNRRTVLLNTCFSNFHFFPNLIEQKKIFFYRRLNEIS